LLRWDPAAAAAAVAAAGPFLQVLGQLPGLAQDYSSSLRLLLQLHPVMLLLPAKKLAPNHLLQLLLLKMLLQMLLLLLLLHPLLAHLLPLLAAALRLLLMMSLQLALPLPCACQHLGLSVAVYRPWSNTAGSPAITSTWTRHA
jgi:hypothetical protein